MVVIQSNENFLAIFSGVIAGFASLFGKAPSIYTENQNPSIFKLLHLDTKLRYEVACYTLYVLSNILMWKFFIKALKYSRNTSKTVILNTISNFTISGLQGYFVFNEEVKVQWFIGLSVIFLGILFILRDKSNEEKQHDN